MRIALLIAALLGLMGALSAAWSCMPPVKAKDLGTPPPAGDAANDAVKKPGG